MNGTTANSKMGISPYRSRPDIFRLLCWVASAITVATLVWIVYEILAQAWPAVSKFGLKFAISASWMPNRDTYGVLPFLIGTVASSLIALLIAFPLGVSISIFLSEDFLPASVRHTIRFVVELLAAIPSVVYGLWGIFVIVPIIKECIPALKHFGVYLFEKSDGYIPKLFQEQAAGNCLLTASIVLALMVLPTITAISRNALVAVPNTLREGAYALGATRWEAILGVILPSASPGIVAATILAFGRAMGETMAVAMLIGNSPRLTWSLLSPSGTLSSLLANQFAEADGMQISALMYAALLLVILTLGGNMMGEAVLRYTQKQTAGIR